MHVFTATAMRQADLLAVEAGISLSTLMDKAGRMVAESAQKQFPQAKKFLVLCGKGNNGGDGFVAARYLHFANKDVTVFEQMTVSETMTTPESRHARESFQRLKPSFVMTMDNLQQALENCDVVIDALLGSGLSRPLQEPLVSMVKLVNDSNKPILSIDVPSGVASDSPILVGDTIQATYTIQLAGAKIASVFYPARKTFGSWEVADIGIPATLLNTLSDIQILDDARVNSWLPVREADANKYTAGTVLVIAGSNRYLGAAELACRAAYRAGAGLVTLAAENRLASSWPEIIFEPLDWAARPLETIRAIGDKRIQARVIGPGLDERVLLLLPDLIMQANVPTVLDAGALIRSDLAMRAIKEHHHCVLTPHYGEAARLFGVSTTDIQRQPLELSRQLALDLEATIVLKGPSTIITNGHQCAVSLRGHSGMATGGTGDVLAGCLGAFLTNTTHLFERSAAAVYLHGLAGETSAKHYYLGLVAHDVIEYFPKVWQHLSR